jgi:heavy metal efflux system protein
LGARPDENPRRCTTAAHGWTDRLRLILISALQVDKAVLFSALITVAGFVPLFTMQGVEGQIFGPMARTYGYALAGALIATFTITPVLASMLLPERREGNRNDRCPLSCTVSTIPRCALR